MRKCAMSIAVGFAISVPLAVSANNSLQPINDVTLSEPPPPWEARPDVDPEAYNNADSTSAVRQKSTKTERVDVQAKERPPIISKPVTKTYNESVSSVPDRQPKATVPQEVRADLGNGNSIESWYEKRRHYQNQQKANGLSVLQQQARTGNSEAQYQLALALQQGLSGKPNVYEAINWFTKAANSGHKEAQYALALIYQSNASTPEDERKFVTWLEKAAEHNHAGAQYYLGMMYANGDQVPKNTQIARQWFEKAENSGHIAAKIALAEMAEGSSEQLSQKQPQAMLPIEPANLANAEVLEAESPLRLEDNMPPPEPAPLRTPAIQEQPVRVSALPKAETKIVPEGEPIESIEVASVSPPAIAAMTMPRQAMKAEPLVAIPTIEENRPIEKTASQAKIVQKSEKPTDIQPKSVAKKAEQTIDEVPQTTKNAPNVAKIRADAKAGDRKAQLILGTLYEDGTGNLSQDYDNAIKWYRLSADQGYAKAQYNLGLLYEDGKGVSQDFYEAAQWYKRAANNGFAEAQNNLGVLYIMGKGVIRDKARAELMFRKSAEQGNKNAQRNLDMLLSEA